MRINLTFKKHIGVAFIAVAMVCDRAYAQPAAADSLRLVGSFEDAVAFSADLLGNFYVIDRGRNEIVKMREGDVLLRSGGYGWDKYGLDRPSDIISPNGLDVYVADYGNHRVIRFDRDLTPLSQIPAYEWRQQMSRSFGYPKSLGLTKFGKLLVVDGENTRLVKFRGDSSIEKIIGGVDAGEGRLIRPVKIRLGNDDQIFVQDGSRIVMFDKFGNYIRSFGKNIFSFSVGESCAVALDSCTMYRFYPAGNGEEILNVGNLLKNCADVRDMMLRDDILYFLTKKSLFSIRWNCRINGGNQ